MSTVAILAFAAGTMNWLLVRSRIWESVALLLVCFTLFRPGFWVDLVYEPYTSAPARQIFEIAERLPENARLTFIVEGTTIEGDDVRKTISLPLSDPGSGRDRIGRTGASLVVAGDRVQVGAVKFGSYAKRVNLEPGFVVTQVLLPADRPSRYWLYVPALVLLGVVTLLQWRRRRSAGAAPALARGAT
jgi:hypothetical protein